MKRILVLVAAVLCLASSAWAKDIAPGTVEIDGATAIRYTDGEIDFEGEGDVDNSALMVSLGTNYYFMQNLGLGLLLSWTDQEIADLSVSEIFVGPQIVYNYSINEPLSVFAAAAVGYQKTEVEVDDDDKVDPDGYGWKAGLGLKYFVSDAFAVNASVNYAASYMEYEGTDWDNTGFLFGAGFSVYLK